MPPTGSWLVPRRPVRAGIAMNSTLRFAAYSAGLAGLLLSGLACKSGTEPTVTPPPPPPPSRSGTMTALVNGVPWAASTLGDSILAFVNLVDADAVPGLPATLTLMGVSFSGTTTGSFAAYVALSGTPRPADFTLGVGANTGGAATYAPGDVVNPFDFHSDMNHLGTLSITSLDLTTWRAKGTFFFDLVRNNGATMEVREGMFDLPMLHNGENPATVQRPISSLLRGRQSMEARTRDGAPTRPRI